nr:UPF0481 protein At3g47200-like [Nicotiana tomentosiformis]
MKPKGEDIIIKAGCMRGIVRRDLLLLENQLPFFVLTKLYDMTTNEFHQIPFINMVKKTFLPFLPKMTPASFNESEGNAAEIKHLLQIVHMSCYPSKMKDMPRDKDHLKVMPNAIELSEAGVSFVKVGYIYRRLDEDDLRDSTSIFDVKFENGLTEIPCFEVDDNTETFLRNLIAYEQQSSDVHPTYFSDFATFMDYLIDSEKDVSLLRLKRIIRNNIGEDKEVASLFNKIGKGVSFSDEFYYKEECIKLVQHCEKSWNRMKASLKRNYFSSPWAGASTVAAVVLLILTAMQTVLAFTGGVK